MSSRARLALLIVAIVAVGLWQLRPHAPARSADAPAAGPVEPLPAPGGASPTPSPRADRAPSPAGAAANPGANTETNRGANTAAYDLAADEAKGGHTLARHVGRSDEQLLERLRRERNISAASTYTDRATAERTVARTLERNRPKVAAWLARTANRPNLALDYRGAPGEILGRSIRRGRRDAVTCTNAIVVLRWDDRSVHSYVLTTYPEAAR